MDMSAVVEQIGKSLHLLDTLLGKLPAPVAETIRGDVAELRELLFEQRAARVALIGDPEVDATTVIDALLGDRGTPTNSRRVADGLWTTWTGGFSELELLDARRLGTEQLATLDPQLAPDLVLDVSQHGDRESIRREIAARLPEIAKQARVQLARMAGVTSAQRAIAEDLTAATASVSAGLAAIPIPIADIAPITALQVSLVAGIGYLSGREMTVRSATEFVAALGANVGAAIVLRHVARAVTKAVLPAAGSLVSAGVAWAGTKAVGAAATSYFIDHSGKKAARKQFSVVVKQPPQLPKPLHTVIEAADRS